ncbi:band 7 protein AGAP004871 isoform X2 [Musca autumnalis]|uniref:band 7 protein AGAP004871 isoform X2 n=1 Tax=Musca autumnalis TaxID=221902 RepID=UPI003CE71AC1
MSSLNILASHDGVKVRDDDYRERIMKVQPIVNGDMNHQASTCGKILIFLSVCLVILTLPFSLFVCFKVVQEYERAVIFRLGRLMQGGAKGPGIFFILPCIDSYARVDLRTRTYDVPPQEVLTKDSVTVSVDAVVYYRVSNATVSIANVENAHHSTRLLAQTTLRNTMGTQHLHEILSERMTISDTMQVQLDEATDAWGIKVERVEIKDVRLPVQLQRAMAAEAEAAREARAKVIAAEGEQKASKALREASEVIGDSPAALQLRYLQTLSAISAEKNSTIVFPLPIDLITYFLKSNDADTIKTAASTAKAIADREAVVPTPIIVPSTVAGAASMIAGMGPIPTTSNNVNNVNHETNGIVTAAM